MYKIGKGNTYGGWTTAPLAHEKWHQQSCREENKCSMQANGSYGCKDPLGYSRYMDDPVNYGMDEVGAYDAKIGILMDWLKENCQ